MLNDGVLINTTIHYKLCVGHNYIHHTICVGTSVYTRSRAVTHTAILPILILYKLCTKDKRHYIQMFVLVNYHCGAQINSYQYFKVVKLVQMVDILHI